MNSIDHKVWEFYRKMDTKDKSPKIVLETKWENQHHKKFLGG